MSGVARRAGFLGDSRALSITALLLASIVSAALFVVSYQGLAFAGEAIGLGSARWIVPVALDGGILVAGLLAAVRRGQRRRATLEVAILWLATVASSGANVAAHMTKGDGWLAVGVASIAPWFFLALTESIIRSVIQDEVAERPRGRKSAPAVASTPTPVSETPVTTSAPRSTRAPAARKPAGDRRSGVAYPFDEVERLENDELLADFDRLTHLLTVDKTVRNADPEAPRLVAIIHTLNARGVPIRSMRERAGLENEVLLRALLRTGKTNAAKHVEQGVAA